MESFVITGATSMIGVALIKECLQNNTRILAVVRPGSSNIYRIPKSESVTIIECDNSQLDSLPKMVKGEFDCFYHLAWDGTSRESRGDAVLHERNISYTLKAVGAAHQMGCKAFVGAGSQAEYGRVANVISPDTPANPEYAYGISKLAAGRLSWQYCMQLGLRFVWGRIFSVYGEYDNKDTMIMYLIRTLLSGEIPELTKCEQMWDYLYCGDAGRAFYLMGKKGEGIYCVGSGKMYPLLEYVTTIRDSIDEKLLLGIGTREYAPQQVMCLCADIERLKKDTGFYPVTDFKTGIKNMIEWFKEVNLK